MKLDVKTIIIMILGATLFGLIGFLIGSRRNYQHTEVPADPKTQKEYKDQVAKAIRSRSSEIRTCYIAFLEKKPVLQEGKVDIVFKVERNGEISGTEWGLNELKDSAIQSCIEKSLQGLRFPPLPLGVNSYVSHTLSFKSEETIKKEIEGRKNLLPKIIPVE